MHANMGCGVQAKQWGASTVELEQTRLLVLLAIWLVREVFGGRARGAKGREVEDDGERHCQHGASSHEWAAGEMTPQHKPVDRSRPLWQSRGELA